MSKLNKREHVRRLLKLFSLAYLSKSEVLGRLRVSKDLSGVPVYQWRPISLEIVKNKDIFNKAPCFQKSE